MPKLPNAPKNGEVKYVTFCNGSRLLRVINNDNNTEAWTFISAALSDLSYSIDLNVDGTNDCKWEDGSTTYSFDVKSFETKSFNLTKSPGAVVSFLINLVSETPLPIQT